MDSSQVSDQSSGRCQLSGRDNFICFFNVFMKKQNRNFFDEHTLGGLDEA